MKRYAKLWKAFASRDFSFEKAINALEEEDDRVIGLVLSELRKAGWISVKQDPNNSRKRLYQLKQPNEAVKEMMI